MNATAFITGASSGFGRGFALKLAADGYGVALAARRVDRIESVAEEIRRGGGAAIACRCDVAEPSQIRQAVARTESELGPVDLLIANAGVSARTVLPAFDAEEVDWVTRVNYLGAVHAVGAVLPGMLERDRGHLVAIGSLAGYSGLPRTAAYGASKAAVYNFFESLRIDLRGTGVDVTVITPGYVRSELTDKNEHRMPYLMEMDDAVDRMVRAIRARKRHVMFPRPLSTLAWIGQVVPRRIYDRLAARQPR